MTSKNKYNDDEKVNPLHHLHSLKRLVDDIEKKYQKKQYFSRNEVADIENNIADINHGIEDGREYVIEIGKVADTIRQVLLVTMKSIKVRNEELKKKDKADKKFVQQWRQENNDDDATKTTVKERLVSVEAGKAEMEAQKMIADLTNGINNLTKEVDDTLSKLNEIDNQLDELARQKELDILRAEEAERQKREEKEKREREEKERKEREEEEERKRLEEEQRIKEEKLRKEKEEREKKEREEEDERKRKQEEKEKQERERQLELQRLAEEKRQRDEYERRKNPNNWPRYRYEIPKPTDIFGRGLGCQVKVPENTIHKEYLQCFVDETTNRFSLNSQEKLLGNFITLKPCKDNPTFSFEFTPEIAIPYKSPDTRHHEIVLRMKQNDRVEDCCLKKKCHDPVEKTDCIWFNANPTESLTAIVLARPKSVKQAFSKSGGKLQSTTDPGIVLTVYPDTFPDEGKVSIKTLGRDMVANAARRIYADEMEQIVDVSPLCYIDIEKTAMKPVTMVFNFPTQDTTKKLPNQRTEIRVIISSGDQWIDRSSQISRKASNVTFDLDPSDKKVLMFRTRGHIDSENMRRTSSHIEEKLKESPAVFIVKQREDDPKQLFLQCCSVNREPDVMSYLNNSNYITGPEIQRNIFFKEGKELSFQFSETSNIKFDEPVSDGFPFYSYFDTVRLEATVSVVDPFRQKNFEKYAGKLQLVEVTSVKEGSRKAGNILAEVTVELPKDQKGANSNVPRSILFYGTEPLTETYMRSLAGMLGDEWKNLGLELGLTEATLQSILQRNSSESDTKYDMLRTWHMKQEITPETVAELITALVSVHRVDLGDDLRQKNSVIEKKLTQSRKRGVFDNIVKEISRDNKALNDWKNILEQFGMKTDVIDNLEKEYQGHRPAFKQGMMQLIEGDGNLSVQFVVEVLRIFGHNGTADIIKGFDKHL